MTKPRLKKQIIALRDNLSEDSVSALSKKLKKQDSLAGKDIDKDVLERIMKEDSELLKNLAL